MQELESGQYNVLTLVCGSCYVRMQKAPYHVSCFGKPTIVDQEGKLLFRGYSAKAEECQRWCPDRALCREVVLGEK